MMNFEEELADLINKHLKSNSYDSIVSALELALMALHEESAQSLREAEAE
jgi:hypothetical protein